MIVKNLLSQKESPAYVMLGSEYKPGHPTYSGCDPGMMMLEKNRHYLAINDQVVGSRHANNWILIEATEEEEQKLLDSGYLMIGLTGV